VSSAASPLQASFALSCRSPIRPHHGERGKTLFLEPGGLNSLASGSRNPSPAGSQRKPDFVTTKEYGEARRETFEEEEEDEPTDRTWFLPPPTPGLSGILGERSGTEDEKLGVMSAISIIVGKTLGVGAYSVPSAVFAGVGSVGMALLLWVLGSLISFCGLAVYLVRFSISIHSLT
jgi:hypothetical protein